MHTNTKRDERIRKGEMQQCASFVHLRLYKERKKKRHSLGGVILNKGRSVGVKQSSIEVFICLDVPLLLHICCIIFMYI